MRALAFVPLLALAACSGETEPVEKKAPAAEQLQAGQWEITTEVTQFVKADAGAARIDTPVGTRETATRCLAEADARKPQPALFAGPKDSCTYRNFYLSGGRIDALLDCQRPGLAGKVMMNVNGTYTATRIEGSRGIDTYLNSDGDVKVRAKITGRHVGQCTPG